MRSRAYFTMMSFLSIKSPAKTQLLAIIEPMPVSYYNFAVGNRTAIDPFIVYLDAFALGSQSCNHIALRASIARHY